MRKNISVALAAYNGEKYIKEQLYSILCQLKEKDEIVISLDPSTDSTERILSSYHDDRIKLIHGSGSGLIKNFENAIAHTSNDIIFLCDQDDIWTNDKVDCVLNSFSDGIYVVMHDCSIVDEELNVIEPSFFQHRRTKLGIVSNIIQNSYIGCCMAFRKELKEYILPFPDPLPMHDQYIGHVGEIKGKNKLIHKPLLYYRRHGKNVSSTSHSSLFQMIQWRFQIIKAIL